jgi:hypothetical protein
MFGRTTEELKDMLEETRNVKMLLMSMLSDAQELEEFGKSNRQLLNCVKYLIDNAKF